MESVRLAKSEETQAWDPQTGGVQVWRSPGHDKGVSSELSGNTAVKHHYGRWASPRRGETQVWNHPTLLSGETQIWNPSELVS